MLVETTNVWKTSIAVCIIEGSPLAASHLLCVLQPEPQIKIYTPSELDHSKCPDPCVFVVDQGTLSVHLSQLLFQLGFKYPGARFLVIDQQLSSEELCVLLSSGAHGFVAYDEIESSLAAAIRTAASGRLRIPPEVLEQYVIRSRSTSKKRLQNPLTARERSIAEMVGRQLSNKEIASALRITESTVKFHLANIFAKLGVRTRALVPKLVAGERRGKETFAGWKGILRPRPASDERTSSVLQFSAPAEAKGAAGYMVGASSMKR